MFKKLLELNETTLAILAVLFIIGITGIIMFKKRKQVNLTTKMMVYGSLCISLSFVLSNIRLYRLPQGGSVTPASMLPMVIYAVVFGPLPGIIAGVAYGLLQYIQASYVVHWAQIIIDYPLAFGFLGLAGLYRKNLIVALVIGTFGRFIMHFLSGIIFFGHYAGDTPVALYSLIYNGSFLGVDLLICIVVSFMPQIQNLVRELKKKSSLLNTY
ncbi:energy-coupled thiamine transporter ThiT [Serpentinicella sp. ANB-PHB4]|uniref:energy-coupled thiamine transporter ThiT n=1 Tax=Serpentinicella sp. ANB-PHB4 TaxID=3074076 RepID=UPI00286064A3|nr:energy-coupled thiamine transporter ThiT [Serpentinicella sp. ANB-PHB4]MDR5659053.1 energy-coupled thiamine transporter ThiT [Serpentinicella sp. ANB-PHB4]